MVGLGLVAPQVAAADNGLTITAVSDAPDSFSPDGDYQYDTTDIAYTLSDAARVTIELRGPSGTLVRTLVDAARTIGSHSETWDGTDDAGQVVPDGLYAYTIDALDGAGNHAAQQQGDILVDTRSPVSLTVPAPGALVTGDVHFVLTPTRGTRTAAPPTATSRSPATARSP